jgi:hypothetical protein
MLAVFHHGLRRSYLLGGRVALTLGLVAQWTAGAEPAVLPNAAKESSLSVQTEVDLSSRYIWRGLELSKGPVLQPSVDVGFGDFKLNGWFNYELGEMTNIRRWNESTLAGFYRFRLDGWNFETSMIGYMYPSPLTFPDTAEAELSVSFEVGKGMEVFVSQAVDMAEYGGACYGEAGLKWESTIGESFSLEVTPYFGWATDRFTEAYADVAAGGFHLIGCEAELRWNMGANLSLRPHVGFSHLFSTTLREVTKGDHFWAGIALRYKIP